MTGRLHLLLWFGVLGLSCEAPPRLIYEACSPAHACAPELTCCPDLVCRLRCSPPDAGAPGPGDAGSAHDGGASSDAGLDDAGAPPDAGGPGADGGSMTCPFSDGGLSGASCEELDALYARALLVARRCNPTSLVEPCTEKRPSQIDCCEDRFINAGSGAELDLLTCLKRLRPDAGRFGCLLAPCPGCGQGSAPRAGQCMPVPDGGPTEGLCENVY